MGENMKKVSLLLAVLLILLISGFAQSAEDTNYELALEHYNNGNFTKTIAILEDYVSQNPKPEAYFLLAYSNYKLNRHEKANEYFKALFLIDPEYSPTPALIEAGKWPPEQMIKEAAAKPAPVERAVEQPKQAAPPPPVVPSAPVEQAAPPSPVIPSAPVEKAAPPPPVVPSAPVQKAAPAPPVPSVVPFKAVPAVPTMPFSPAILIAIFAAMYILICLPIFLIARKLNVPGAWTAWIPIIQVWAILKSADKPLWWVLLMLVPLVNLFVFIYIWMCITENLGKNKWLGVLMIVPFISILFPYYLAFSKIAGATAEAIPEDFDLGKEPELDIGDTSFLDEEPEPFAEEPAPAEEESFFEEETEQPAEEPASLDEEPAGWESEAEEEPEQPAEEPASLDEEPAGGEREAEDESLAWSESDEEQSEDETLAWGESDEEQSEDETLAWGESDEDETQQ
jgi:hypothetical protein